jgi:hypothetical protein
MVRLGFDSRYLAGGLERTPQAAPATITPAAEPLPADDVATSSAGAGTFEFEFTGVDGDDDA